MHPASITSIVQSRMNLICVGCLLAAVTLPAFATRLDAEETGSNSEQFNVLFLISDDLNCRMGCYGDPIVQTPNLDRLAARGVRFENAYCQFPLCGPSRNSMLCGLYPDSTGIVRNAEIFRQSIPNRISMPQAFRLDGYHATRIGKLYHYNVPKSVGTNGHDDPTSWEIEINPAGCDRLIEEPETFSLIPGSFGGTLSWLASPRPESEHTDSLMADEAAWMLRRYADRPEKPFFMAVGFFRPHTPYVAPKKYFEPYRLEEMPIATDIDEDIKDVPAAALMSAKKEQEALSDDLRRQAIQAYYASITFMDAQVGKVLDALEQTGLSDKTVIVFTSDHGYHLGAKGLWQKQSLFDESSRVPLILAGPGIRSGEVAPTPVGLVDLYPTLTQICDVPSPELMHGQSLVPILREPTQLGRGYAISQVLRTVRKQKKQFDGYTIRTPRYRLTLWDGGREGVELYDHESDPLEKTNLAYDASRPDRMTGDTRLKRIIDELSETLRSEIAVATPASGRPSVNPGGWSINLTDVE